MTTYDELRADLDTVTGLLHDLEARMAVRIKEHARMKEALEYYADIERYNIFPDRRGAAIQPDMDWGQKARRVLRSLSKENP